MLDRVFANRVNKNQIGEGAVIYYFKNSKGKVLAIASSGKIYWKSERVILYSGTTCRFIDYIKLTAEPERKSEVKYWVVD